MLSQKTIEIVKSTVPVLEEHGTTITTCFYQQLFENHPELLNIFNHANQKKGRQQQALANAVYAAAAHIDQLETILPVVKQIAHKHRSLGIKPEHYPIVGEHLLLAIKEVLGDQATDEIIEAWGEAYGVIADVFIQVEKDMYQEAAEKEGGWKDFRPFIVDKKVKESDVITSFYLVPADGGKLADYLPGQYLSVKVKIEGEAYTQIRQYSLSDAPGKPYYRISVKREEGKNNPDGKISNHLHNHVKEGDTLEVSAPAGDFTLDLDSDRPVVLLSGGVGLTPMMSMLRTIVEQQPGRKVTFIHAAQNGNVHALDEQVKELARANGDITSYVVYSNPTEADKAAGSFDKEGYVTLPWLKEVLGTNQADFYFCGPVPFMSAINQFLMEWQVPEHRIHFEFFGPAMNLETVS
ncbi:NO-inducible flavohemoprotein [Sediminibacillus halophilus]|uniref:Flavohemoprotein n=1 Tax=Sediminibacillus halophilus TaxID=482461 RepID=A0A1G9TJQ1_9BACI|nr:NO-inducible flavohemoprotein [Sediminibacillus halophilus]SDM47890.1 nitric oxide dioxygenase [Sediminibacillus halophilus]